MASSSASQSSEQISQIHLIKNHINELIGFNRDIPDNKLYCMMCMTGWHNRRNAERCVMNCTSQYFEMWGYSSTIWDVYLCPSKKLYLLKFINL